MKIKNITRIDRNEEDVYNLEVEDNHNYYANDVLVSNCHMIRNHNDGKAVLELIEKTGNAYYRMGCTGTLRDCAINKLQIVGMFGRTKKITSTRKLMDDGYLSKLKIKPILIKYPMEVSAQISALEWDSQQEFIESDENPRQQLIWELANSLKNNTLILFRKITHGTYIYEQLLANTSKKVHYIDGKVKVDDREIIRKEVDASTGNIIVLHFDDIKISVNDMEKVPLVDGKNKLAKDITEKDDVDDKWIDEHK